MITVPNIPTDNYYKFHAITGIVIVLTSMIYYDSRLYEVGNELDKIGIQSERLRLERQILNEKKEIYQLKIKAAKKMEVHIADLYDSTMTKTELLELYVSYKEKIIPFEYSAPGIQLEGEKLSKVTDDIKRKEIDIKSNLQIIKDKNYQFKKYFFVLILLLIWGYRMSHIGFRNWYNRVQKPSDEKLAIELAQLKLQMEKNESKPVD